MSAAPEEEKFPEIAEYDEIISAYHGTDARCATLIVSSRFTIGHKSTLYLGDGVYFYQGCRDWALDWARTHDKIPPVVIRSIVSMGKCLDFTNKFYSAHFLEFCTKLRTRLASKERTRSLLNKMTDATVINMIANKTPVDTVRAEYHLDRRAFEASKIRLDSRLVVCVRNLDKIRESEIDTNSRPSP